MRILLLDDNPDAVAVLENFLKVLDHQVTSFTDGRDALLWLNDVKPQIIIADLDMPIMDGFDFVKRVRAYGSYASTPIICITGTDASDEQIAAGGFFATLRKPTTLSDVMGAIDEVQNGQSAGNQSA